MGVSHEIWVVYNDLFNYPMILLNRKATYMFLPHSVLPILHDVRNSSLPSLQYIIHLIIQL